MSSSRKDAAPIRTPDCVVWVDLPTKPGDTVLNLTIYGENTITLERNVGGQAPAKADYGYVRTLTTSKVDIKPFKNKTVEQKLADDPTYVRAYQRRPAELLPQGKGGVDTGLKQTSAYQPAPPSPPPQPLPPPGTAAWARGRSGEGAAATAEGSLLPEADGSERAADAAAADAERAVSAAGV